MTRNEFKELCDHIVDIYGVTSYQDNLNDDPEDEINDELWVFCPNECDEPILWEDYGEEMEIETDRHGQRFVVCPICWEHIAL